MDNICASGSELRTGAQGSTLTEHFFSHPILNSPYERPDRHWELDGSGQPTDQIVERRRGSSLVSPIPKSKKSRGKAGQSDLYSDRDDLGLDQEYNPTEVINGIRSAVESWRSLPESQWQVTPSTARLLRHWRSDDFQDIRPFFCQVEAVETVIWLVEVAPKSSAQGKRFWAHVEASNAASNPDLLRLALKLATGAGKTTVMAMLIAWQTINAVRHPDSKRFTRGFLIVAPGITIKDRLRVLQPNDPDSYYRSREIVPEDLLGDLGRAKIVITNYHAFKKKDELPLNKVQQAALATTSKPESDGKMLQRVCGALLGMKRIMVLNDEAHHCYRERPEASEEADLKGEEKQEAKENNEAARLWISGLEALRRQGKLGTVFDLSATPFFLKGSGYREGSLFGWTVSDFNLMDAIESGIVKLPRVPIIDNVAGGDTPMFRNLWEHVGHKLPKKGRGQTKDMNPQQLPPELLTAIDALYGHYIETRDLWRKAEITVDPVFIVVCNNTATSKLVHDYIAGYEQENDDGTITPVAGRCALFRNFDPDGTALPRMRTLLIDSQQIESGEAISKEFKQAAASELDRFRSELVQRSGDQRAGDNVSDEDILREVMNTVGEPGRLGEGIRCVVSVSMLTEGWDCNTVTHILGVRAFGTQLLCEQVIGRALRRQSYAKQDDGKFKVEYADVLGIPFDFTAAPVKAKPVKPDNLVNVRAISPERDKLEIRFPRVEGYRTELPQEKLTAQFTENSTLELNPKLVGAGETTNSGIIGESTDLTLKHLEDMRRTTILFNLTNYIIQRKFAEPGEPPKMHLFPQLKSIVRQWMDEHLSCVGGTFPAQILYQRLSDMAANRIMDAITLATSDAGAVKAILDAFNREGSTRHVSFNTSRPRFETDPRKCHINYCILDSDWEGEFCRVAEKHPHVLAYVKNHNLGFEVPYRHGPDVRRYRPDYIVRIDDGHGKDNPLNLVVEIKGYRGEDAKDKAATMETYWVPGVNNLGQYGRWAFAEFRNVWTIQGEFEALIEGWFDEMVGEVA
jgi:type III restriction enzyme